MTDLKAAISQALKEALMNRKVSVSSAAKILGVSRQAVHSYLNGTSLPRPRVLSVAVRTWDLRFSIGNASFDKSSFPEPKLSSVPLQTSMTSLFDSIKAEDLKLDVARSADSFSISVSIKVA